jgi:hypothetical protein
MLVSAIRLLELKRATPPFVQASRASAGRQDGPVWAYRTPGAINQSSVELFGMALSWRERRKRETIEKLGAKHLRNRRG